jgi:hypothetical protein
MQLVQGPHHDFAPVPRRLARVRDGGATQKRVGARDVALQVVYLKGKL